MTSPHCWQKIAEEELEKDSIVQCLRKYGYEGPISREDYVSFNWAGGKIRPWNWDFEEELELLRDYSGMQWPWPKRKRRK